MKIPKYHLMLAALHCKAIYIKLWLAALTLHGNKLTLAFQTQESKEIRNTVYIWPVL